MKSTIKQYIFTWGKLALFILAIVLIQNRFCLAGEYKQIVIATGSPFELGLVQAISKPFEKETGYTVRVIKTPTEPGLELGKNGFTHITMGHAREATAKLIQEGFALKHADLMYNITVIVGPKDDPAKIEGLKDLTVAHKKIHEAKANYLARGDGGGMDLLEKKIWASLRLNYTGQPWYSVMAGHVARVAEGRILRVSRSCDSHPFFISVQKVHLRVKIFLLTSEIG